MYFDNTATYYVDKIMSHIDSTNLLDSENDRRLVKSAFFILFSTTSPLGLKGLSLVLGKEDGKRAIDLIIKLFGKDFLGRMLEEYPDGFCLDFGTWNEMASEEVESNSAGSSKHPPKVPRGEHLSVCATR